MTAFHNPAYLAELLDVPEDSILRWRREQSWPSLKVGRQIRFTQEHVEQILASLESKPEPKPAVSGVVVAGQTKRSARTRRAS